MANITDRRIGKRKKNERNSVRAEYELQPLFDVFYTAKMAEGIKSGTLRNYRTNWQFFLEYLDIKGLAHDVRHVTTELIRQYIVWMLTEKRRFDGHKYKPEDAKTVGLSPVTVNTRINTMRTMFKFLYEEGKIEFDPFASVKNVEQDAPDIEILTIEELRALLAVPNQRRYSEFRDYVLMTLLMDAMLRINEALSLKVSDIDRETSMVSVRAEIAKNRSQRSVPIQRRTLNLLLELIKENGDFDSEYVFLANYGEQLTQNNFRNRLHNYAKKAGVAKAVHPHLFRHTSATLFLEAGGDLRHLQILLGHKDLRMVMRYTHLSKSSLKNQHNQYSPLNQVLSPLSKERKIKR
ncbi:tyrosine-type recombinase/integrase [Aneurinibacillus aneurinilyticus]|uniref:Tyrosine-type recombinase/integrase n=1 Tax=Aneurinibacillus aneurinilyticus TaxID=1391 RepID=A0A848CRH1_ANEAE|nr:tyrosine-type recombinase/integrase [Aneurinibacillus aneurinilyticus]NMF00065.1 tyrosine-type recombinase/integrase [Aneurinibacillus aneurinilyticus]